MIIPYASRTGGPNLEGLRRAGWRLMISAWADHRDEGMPYAIDNGAWSAHTHNAPWPEDRFRALVASHGARADFVVVPDIVAGGLESLRLSERWLPELDAIKLRLIAVQDGMAPWDVEPLLGPGIGLFIGGSTTPREVDPRGGWKWRSLAFWAHLARRRGCYLHVGRVNSIRQIQECIRVGADSFDGTSASRWGKTLRKLDNARHHAAFDFDQQEDAPWGPPSFESSPSRRRTVSPTSRRATSA